MRHDAGKRKKPPRRVKALPRAKRTLLGHCDFGDQVESLVDGRKFWVTGDINGHPWGREILKQGKVGDFERLDQALPIRVLESY